MLPINLPSVTNNRIVGWFTIAHQINSSLHWCYQTVIEPTSSRYRRFNFPLEIESTTNSTAPPEIQNPIHPPPPSSPIQSQVKRITRSKWQLPTERVGRKKNPANMGREKSEPSAEKTKTRGGWAARRRNNGAARATARRQMSRECIPRGLFSLSPLSARRPSPPFVFLSLGLRAFLRDARQLLHSYTQGERETPLPPPPTSAFNRSLLAFLPRSTHELQRENGVVRRGRLLGGGGFGELADDWVWES